VSYQHFSNALFIRTNQYRDQRDVVMWNVGNSLALNGKVDVEHHISNVIHISDVLRFLMKI
jgi:hypothetical protein